MRLHRFFIEEPIGAAAEVSLRSAELANQLSKVFRLKTGDRAILFDGSGSDYECEITDFDKRSVSFRVSSSSRSRYVPPHPLYLCAALVKKDNFEYIVEKATELGVTDIIPVMAERSEKKGLNAGRLEKIALEASEQSGRGTVPKIHEIASLEQSIQMLKEKGGMEMAVFHTEGNRFDMEIDGPAAVFIGPEGGWSPAELDLFEKNKIAVRCLGSQVLRAETAVVAALSQVVFSH